jgi:hypothetical protein
MLERISLLHWSLLDYTAYWWKQFGEVTLCLSNPFIPSASDDSFSLPNLHGPLVSGLKYLLHHWFPCINVLIFFVSLTISLFPWWKGHASLLLSDNISYYIPVICDNNSRYLTYLFLFLSTWPFICCSQKRSTGNSVYQALRTNTFSSHFKPFLIYVYYLIHSSYYPFTYGNSSKQRPNIHLSMVVLWTLNYLL